MFSRWCSYGRCVNGDYSLTPHDGLLGRVDKLEAEMKRRPGKIEKGQEELLKTMELMLPPPPSDLGPSATAAAAAVAQRPR
eukprot:SAG22_NODE_1419_length_4466_cov_5.588963_2_plen_81_part_00